MENVNFLALVFVLALMAYTLLQMVRIQGKGKRKHKRTDPASK
jgi:hypothetical protein